jgi:acetolactate synthase-1/2/3 large subunit
MAWTLPGAIGAKVARPDVRVLVATGDGGFLMNSQEIETALRERIHMVILIWVDDAYGLISWKMDLEIGHHVDTTFGNPDFVAYAESFGAVGYQITSPDQLLPTLQTALAADTVSVIACPVDYSANLELIRSLGELDESLS